MGKNMKTRLLDDNEEKVLQILKENGRASYKEVASKTGLTRHTVARIVKNLEDSGVIWGYSAITQDNLHQGRRLFIIAVKFKEDQNVWKEIVQIIERENGKGDWLLKAGLTKYCFASFVHGHFDFMVMLPADDIFEARRCVNRMGVEMGKYFEHVQIIELLAIIRRCGFLNPNLTSELLNLFGINNQTKTAAGKTRVRKTR